MDKIKVALLGTGHAHAVGFWHAFKTADSEATIIGYADVPPYDGQDAKEKALCNLGKEAMDTVKHYPDYRELLAQKPDLVMLSSDNLAHGTIACETLGLGIPTIVEKPMAISYDDAKKMADCAAMHNTMLAVNWPIAWYPAFNRAIDMAQSGRIGKIMRVVYRSPATWGPYSYSEDGKLPDDEFLKKTWWYRHKNGGGSLLDYACYGAAISTWCFNKQAQRVTGVCKNFTLENFDVEDYSAMILDFGDCLGLLEGSWSSYNCGEIPSGPVIYGTEGTIVCDRHHNWVKLYCGRCHTYADPTEVIECESELPQLHLERNIIDHLKKGTPLHPLLESELNVKIAAALDAGRKSAEIGKTVEIQKKKTYNF